MSSHPQPSKRSTNYPATNHEAPGAEPLVAPPVQHLDPQSVPHGTLASSFSRTKKWRILTIIFLVQCSMNLNASIYSNALEGIAEEYKVTEQDARYGAAIFLVAYAFGCELWAPWSEEVGRKSVLQMSLGLVNLFNFPVLFAPNLGVILFGRFMGGLCSAGGSVTLGMIADMFTPDDQQYAVAFIVFGSVLGSIIGPIAGGFIQESLSWKWCIWVQLIAGTAVQILHYFFVPETRATTRIDRLAKQRRKNDPAIYGKVYGPGERTGPWYARIPLREMGSIWARPFKMFYTEPIVLWLSLLSGFSDALIFMQFHAFELVYNQWGFSPSKLGLTFVPICVGYLIAWASYIPIIKRDRARRKGSKPGDPNFEWARFESRLWWLLFLAPCLPVGLIIFAWTSGGPPMHWAGTMVGSTLIGIANYAIYMATIDYMIAAYGAYSSSATGGNGFMRDFLAGVLTTCALQFYRTIPPFDKHLQMASTVLFIVSLALVGMLFRIYRQGSTLREKSGFAKSLWTDGKGSLVVSEGTRKGDGPGIELQTVKANKESESAEGSGTGADLRV